MDSGNRELEMIIGLARSRFGTGAETDWSVSPGEYLELSGKALKDLAMGASQNRKLLRIVGISGSGKTSQVLPAVRAYAQREGLMPVVVAAREFVKYHPHYKEIIDSCSEGDLRRNTDEFVTVMLFLVLAGLIKRGYDVILDVALLDPKTEAILIKMADEGRYDYAMYAMAVSGAVAEYRLRGREWRHAKETEDVFAHAMREALLYYAKQRPTMRIVMWGAYDSSPIYDGEIQGCVAKYDETVARTDLPKNDDFEAQKEAKIQYLMSI